MAAEKGIYKILSKVSPHKIYIGSSLDITRRWRMHKRELMQNRHHSIILQNHVNKYGIDDLTFEIVELCSESELISTEQRYIDELKPMFNIRKIADSNRGIKRSNETKEKLRIFNTGKKLSTATKEKMSKCKIGNSYSQGITPKNAKQVIYEELGIIFKNINDAAEYIGIKRTTLNAQLIGQNKNKSGMRYV